MMQKASKQKSSLKPGIKVYHKSVFQRILRRKIERYKPSFCLFTLSHVVSQCKKKKVKLGSRDWAGLAIPVWDDIFPFSSPLQCRGRKFHFIVKLTYKLRNRGK